MKILIDNGHGINTPGKRSPDEKLKEGVYAREIAHNVVDGLLRLGYDAELLVPEDSDIDLPTRAHRANVKCSSLGKDNVILVSIHCNAAGSDGNWHTGTGWEVWTSVGQTKSDDLAECLYEKASAILPSQRMRADLSDGDHDKEKHLYILRKTLCPAVLTENLFQDCKKDVEFLLSQEGKEAITRLHLEGIVSYIKSLER